MDVTGIIWFLVSLVIGYYTIEWIYSICFRREYLSARNKAVLVTGCGSGFGYDLAIRLSKLGYQVIAACRSVEGDKVETLRSYTGIEVIQLDVTNEEHISSAVKTVTKNLGNNVLWAVVNNAGVSQVGEIEWCAMETILKIVDVNVFGLIRITKAFLPLIKASKGRIVNVTSMTGKNRLPGSVIYAMSKAAASRLSNGLRLEMRKWGIQVIEIAPYFYGTRFIEKERIDSQLRESWNKAEPEVKSSLGTKYFEKYAKSIHTFLEILRTPDTDVAIDCMVEAVASQSPKLLYEPKNIMNAILVDTTQYLPLYLQDFLLCLIMPKLRLK